MKLLAVFAILVHSLVVAAEVKTDWRPEGHPTETPFLRSEMTDLRLGILTAADIDHMVQNEICYVLVDFPVPGSAKLKDGYIRLAKNEKAMHLIDQLIKKDWSSLQPQVRIIQKNRILQSNKDKQENQTNLMNLELHPGDIIIFCRLR